MLPSSLKMVRSFERSAKDFLPTWNQGSPVPVVSQAPGRARLAGGGLRGLPLRLGLLAEHPGEDRVDVLEVVAEVEQLAELGVGEGRPPGRPSGNPGNCPRRARPSWRCAAPPHRPPRGDCPSGSAPAARAASAPGRPGGRGSWPCSPDRSPAAPSRWPGGAARSRGARWRPARCRARREEWLMSRSCQRATFSMRRDDGRADQAGQAGQVLGEDRVALVRHGARALLARVERLFGFQHLGALQVADLGRQPLDRGGDDAPARRNRRRGGRAGSPGSRPARRPGPSSRRHRPRPRGSTLAKVPTGAGDGAGGDLEAGHGQPLLGARRTRRSGRRASGRRWWARRGWRGCGRPWASCGARRRGASAPPAPGRRPRSAGRWRGRAARPARCR